MRCLRPVRYTYVCGRISEPLFRGKIGQESWAVFTSFLFARHSFSLSAQHPGRASFHTQVKRMRGDQDCLITLALQAQLNGYCNRQEDTGSPVFFLVLPPHRSCSGSIQIVVILSQASSVFDAIVISFSRGALVFGFISLTLLGVPT